MILYEVTARPDDEHRAAYETFMRQTHIADVMSTGYFLSAHFEQASDGSFRTTYVAADQQRLDLYVERDAPRMRAHFAESFPSGVALSREIWRVLQEWHS
jgi:hypothetical protein